MIGLRSNEEHHSFHRHQFKKDVGELGQIHLVYTDQGSKTNRGVLNKVMKQYENPDDSQQCTVNIFDNYFALLPSREKHFYFRAVQ